VTIDPLTGYFSGRAWGENIGWVSFSPGAPLDSTARTSWCDGAPNPPGPGISLTVGKSAGQLVLSWTSNPAASWYDVVTGNLSTLRSSGGDFTVATSGCAIEKATTTSQPLAQPAVPAAWFLVRGANCRGRGTYDTGVPSQVGQRDAEIDASSADCP
jgi:hypothetical protein